MESSLISVVVPVYKVEKYLKKCIDSIISQTYRNIELILVDDESPDKCGAICDDYAEKDARIKVIHKINAGVSAARNSGIAVAQGNYIMFVDSDDYIDQNMLEDMMKYRGSDIIVSGLRFVDKNNRTIREGNSEIVNNMSMSDFLNKYYVTLEKDFILSGPYNKLFSVKTMRENLIYFNESMSICEDGLFVTHFLSCCKNISCVNKCYYNYVQYNDGSTLTAKYNLNSIEAAEILHNARKDLLDKFGCDSELYKYSDARSYSLFKAFLTEIYTRSKLKNFDKYKKAKEALANPTFFRLIKEARRPKDSFLKAITVTKNYLLLHVIFTFIFRKKR